MPDPKKTPDKDLSEKVDNTNVLPKPEDLPKVAAELVDGKVTPAEIEAAKVAATEGAAEAGSSHADNVSKQLTEADDAGKVHTEYTNLFANVSKEQADKDFAKVTYDVEKDKDEKDPVTIEDIRFNSKLLTEKEGKTFEEKKNSLKEETARRLKLYTTPESDGWFKLDYEKLGRDKHGMSHELYVGLGDILLDPTIQTIAIHRFNKESKQWETIKAKRGYARNRPSFVDENGEYIATRTGDKFRVLSNDQLDKPAFNKWVDDDNKAREGGKATFTRTSDMYKAEAPVTLKEDIKLSHPDYKENGKPAVIDNAVIKAAEQECTKSGSVKDILKRKNYMKIVNYCALRVGVPSYMIVAAHKHETGATFAGALDKSSALYRKIHIVADGGLAQGMGQFHPAAAATQKSKPLFSEIMSEVINEDPAMAGRGESIVADILMTALMIKSSSEVFGFDLSHNTPISYMSEGVTIDGITMARLAWSRMFYHVPSYARAYAKVAKGGEQGERFLQAKEWMFKDSSTHQGSYNAYSDTSQQAAK